MVRVGKYEEKIKFDKVWVYQNGDTLKQGSPNSNFLTTDARRMNFLEKANTKKR